VQEQAAIDEFAVQGKPLRFALAVGVALSVLAWPPVARATRIPIRFVFELWVLLAAWFGVAHRLLYRRARQQARAFYTLVFGNTIVGAVVSLALPVLAGTPDTPLWAAFVAMACIIGASETSGSLTMGIFHGVAPLGTIPFFLQRGCPPERAIAVPLIIASASMFGYWYLARRRDHWRRDRHEREMAAAQNRLAESEKERRRLARDLHDTVGTALSLVGLYGSLAEHRADDAAESRRLAASIRSAASAALRELRGMIQSLPQDPAPVRELVAGLAVVARRTLEPAGVSLEVAIRPDADVIVGGKARTTLVRIFQEAVHNALFHGRPARIQVVFAVEGGRVEMVVRDNGVGFEPSAVQAGTGIAGMRERAREMGGDLAVSSTPGAGAVVHLRLPLQPQLSA
jgi:signal transduction histidine kinase